MRRTWVAIGLLSAWGWAGGVAAQNTVTGRGASVRIGGQLHPQYAHSSVESANDDLILRRIRVTMDITVNDFLDGRVEPDFAFGSALLQDTYFRLTFSPALMVSMGQFKRAFDLFEMYSEGDLSIIERDGRVAGVTGCQGVDGICSYGRMTSRLLFAGRDQGVRVEGARGSVFYQVTATNGPGLNVSDENDAKSFSGRVTVGSSPDLRVSAQVAVHDYQDPDDDAAYALGWSADVERGTWRDGLLLQGAIAGGQNWRSLDANATAARFLAFQGFASYYSALAEGGRIAGVEPLVRVSWADPDTDGPDDGGLVVTPGFMLYVTGRNKIGVNLDLYSPQTGDAEYSFKVQSFLYY